MSQRKDGNFIVQILFIAMKACFYHRHHQGESTVIVFVFHVGCLVPNFCAFHLLFFFISSEALVSASSLWKPS